MARKGKLIRRILFSVMSFEQYLTLLSRLFFVSYKLGFLRNNPVYKYYYFVPKLIQKGHTVLDIGANLGYFSRLFAQWVGKEGKVYSVEPVKPMLKVLRTNTASYLQVTILPYALGTENKPITLGNNSRSEAGFIASGSHFVLDAVNTSEEHAQVEFDAEMRKGSELFASLPKVDFIKCDIEGYETVVLPELEGLLVRTQPIVLLETNGEKRREMVAFFENLQFQAYEWMKPYLIPADPNGQEDILFIPHHKLDSVSRFLRS